MVFDLVTRFSFAEGNGSPLWGRAYVFDGNFEKTYGNSSVAINYVGDVVRMRTPDLDAVRESGITLAGAIVWATPERKKMIDLFGWDLEGGDWKTNPSIRSWVVENGIIVPGRTGSIVTCGNGFKLVGDEETYRSSTLNLAEYLSKAPVISWLRYSVGDFCST